MKNTNTKLTHWEWKGLTDGINIADGHAHQTQTKEYLKIIKKLPKLFLEAESKPQRHAQMKFEEVFFSLAGQKSYKKLPQPLYHFSCSTSIEVVANFLRQKNKSVALLHPTFDNLADILKRHNLKLIPLEEHLLQDPENGLKSITADVIFLVSPNNPTGFEMTKEQFLSVIKFCKRNNKLLILDCSFRFYSSFITWDQYQTLHESGIDFIVLEDTGKTWPTLELKVGTTVSSKSIHADLLDITNDFLLNVSPFIFSLVTEYLKVELRNKSFFSAKKITASNREVLKKAFIDLPFELINPDSKLSVAWIKLPNKISSKKFCKWLEQQNIHVLPGGPFYWNNQKYGDNFFRIALLRPEEKFKKAIKALRKALLIHHSDRINSQDTEPYPLKNSMLLQ